MFASFFPLSDCVGENSLTDGGVSSSGFISTCVYFKERDERNNRRGRLRNVLTNSNNPHSIETWAIKVTSSEA